MRSDEELVRECRRGDARAWEALVRRHQERILNLAYQFAGNREDAGDLAQEIFVRLYHKLAQYDSDRAFRTWFNSLARNLCIDFYRQRRQRPARHPLPVEEFHTLAASTEGPDRCVERRSEREFLLRAMDELATASREAIVLKDLQGHSVEEIAGMLSLPEGTVKSRLFRARIELAEAVVRLRQPAAAGGGERGL